MTLGQLCLVAALLAVIGVTQLLSLRSTLGLDRATQGFSLAQNLTDTVADAQRDALGTQVAIQKVALGTGSVADAQMQAALLGRQLRTLLPQEMPADARARVEHAARDQERLLAVLARLDGAPRSAARERLPALQALVADLAGDMKGLHSRFEITFYDRMSATLGARAARQRWILGGAMLACLIGAGLAWSLRRAVRRDFERAYDLLLDETEEREAAQEEALRGARELEHLAFHDRLTGLPNRLRFERELDELGGRELRGAVALVDLDGLGAINRSFGKTVGDELLITSAARLVATAGAGGFVAHLGGDEFAVVWTDAGAEAEAGPCARLLLAALAEPAIVGGRRVVITASVGVACGRLADGNGHELLRNADAALHRAKIEGTSSVTMFDELRHRELQERSAVAARLSRAESAGELVLHYQPLVHAGAGSAAGLEALLRWNRDGKLVPPGEFIPVAEESGLIVPMGAWAIDRACRDLRALRATPSHRHLYASVNLSASQLRDLDLVPYIGACLARHGLPPGSLVVELTESAIVEDHAHAEKVLAALRAIGVRVAIDDFGTGYSSLGYLKQFPADILKIDRSLIADIASDVRSVRLLEGIVSLAHDLGMRVTVEGVETEEQLALVRAAGCDTIQGFLVARPEPLDGVHGLLDRLPAMAQAA